MAVRGRRIDGARMVRGWLSGRRAAGEVRAAAVPVAALGRDAVRFLAAVSPLKGY